MNKLNSILLEGTVERFEGAFRLTTPHKSDPMNGTADGPREVRIVGHVDTLADGTTMRVVVEYIELKPQRSDVLGDINAV